MFKYEWLNRKVKDSPVGGGNVTGISQAGFPSVEYVTVGWMEFEDGEIFDPHGIRDEWLRRHRPEGKVKESQ